MEVRKLADLERFSAEKMAKANLFQSERFFLDLYGLEPGQSQKVHSHSGSDKVYCVLRGEVEATVGTETRALREGEAVLARAGEPHGLRNASSARAVCLVFMAPHPSSGS